VSDLRREGIYISRNGKTFGPYPNDLLIQYIQDGLVWGTDFIYLPKQKKWEKIAVVYEQFLIEKKESHIEESESDKGEVLDQELRKEYEAEPFVDSLESTYSPGLKESPVKPLSDWLGIDNKELGELSENAVSAYKPFPIHRAGKKDRWIEAPTERLKGVQRLILDRLLINIPLNGAAHGFVPKRSILTHASQHRRKRWVVSLDIRSFFPSVSRGRVREVAEELPIPKEDIKHFVNLTTRNDHLPQGAPTSPTLGNLVLRRLDMKLCDLVRGTGWFYTRYADDLTFSGFQKPKEVLLEASRLIKEEGFGISGEKSRIRGKDQRQMVTGIVVNDKLSLSKEKRNMVRAMRHRLQTGQVPDHEMNHVLGWINFADYVERSNHMMPRTGPSVRPRRIPIKKLLCALGRITQGESHEDTASFLGISVSSVRRSFKDEYLQSRIRNASLQELEDLNLSKNIFSGFSALHLIAESGRLLDLELKGFTPSDLLRIDFEGETILGRALRAPQADPQKSHALLGNLLDWTETTEQIEKICKLVFKGSEELALDLAIGLNSPEVFDSLLFSEGESFAFPHWLYFNHCDFRSFALKLFAAMAGINKGGIKSPLQKFSALDFSFCDFITDLNFLKGCENLKELNLQSCTSLNNLDGLGECTNLTKLNLDNCRELNDLSGLASLTQLNELNCRTKFSSDFLTTGQSACFEAWDQLGPDKEEFDEYQFVYTGTIASSAEPYLIFSDKEFHIDEDQLSTLEEGNNAWQFDYDAVWFKPIREELEKKCEKWGPSLCVKINGRWAIMGYYPN